MNRITWYIFRQHIGPFFFITLTLTSVIWLTQSLRFLDLIINRGLSGSTILYLTLLLLPNFLVLIIPITVFCSVLFVYYKLQNDSELVVMKAAGLSQWRLMQPILRFGLITTFILFIFTLILQPLGFGTFKDKQFTFRHNLAPVIGQEGVFNTIIPGVTVFVRERGSAGELKGILVHDERNRDRPVTMIAKEGSFVILDDSPFFVLSEGNRQEFRQVSNQVSLLYFDRYVVNLGTIAKKPKDRWREGSERFLHELFNPGDSPDDIENYNKLRAEGHRRILTPFYALCLALIAGAGVLSISNERRKKWHGPVIASIAALGFEIIGYSILSIIPKIPQITPLIYLHILLTISIALLIILKQPKFKFNSLQLHQKV
ncbi:MAG: LPS export ABC transporter permease LptF [Rhodospirillaceae bacterium]|nr:LPS export ABC transporter permease LptF [Rhodospirillaceae bacterium]|tara:strand:- start:199 stop:1317 length:1119 start_codon:yes stop_codon:yes gene_type:complete